MRRNGVKKWDGVRGNGGTSRGGLQTSNTRGDVLNEVFANLNAFRFGGFGGSEGQGGGAEGRRKNVAVCAGRGGDERGTCKTGTNKCMATKGRAEETREEHIRDERRGADRKSTREDRRRKGDKACRWERGEETRIAEKLNTTHK